MTTYFKEDRIPRIVIMAVASVGVTIMLFILFSLIRDSIPILTHVTLSDLLLGTQWYPTYDPPEFGMLPLLIGSLSVTLAASVISLPVSLALAVFLSEICPSTLREILKPVIEILGFFPSVVLGFIGMVVIAPWMVAKFDIITGLNLLNASVLMGIMIIPIVTSLAEDSLNSVPKDIRDASFALGATRLETVLRSVIPAALPGLMTASLLGVMRAIGETMVVLMAAGGSAIIPHSIMDPVRPLTSAIAAEMGETPFRSDHYFSLFFAGLLLLILTLALNMTALWIEQRGKRWRS
ncbi:MAG: phosphate ABC transporter permease subunit PstC [Thermovirga sp.]